MVFGKGFGLGLVGVGIDVADKLLNDPPAAQAEAAPPPPPPPGSRPAARMGDFIGHGAPSGAIMFGAPTVIIAGQVAARLGDPVECKIHGPGGNITMGSVTVIIAGACAARMGDPTACCAPGVAGQGASPTQGTPGSYNSEFEGIGPDHKNSGYDNEDGEQRVDDFRLWGDKNSWKLWGFQYEQEQSLFSGKSEGHRNNNHGNYGGGAQGNAATRKETITLPNGQTVTRTTTGGNGQAGVDFLMGSDGRRTGFNWGGSAQVSAIEDQVEHKDEMKIPFTDWSIQRNTTAGGSAGAAGGAINMGAYHDNADDRYHVNLMTDIEAIVGVKLGLDISIGRSSSSGGGGGSPGAGAVGLAGAITSGCMTVLIGG